MALSDLIALATAQHWLPLILLLTVIVRRWTAPDSKFPIDIAPQWRPVVTATGGLVYGLVSSLQQGMAPLAAILGTLTAAGAGGFLDGVLIAIFNKDNAPKWAKAIVFIFDDLTGASPPPPPATKVGVAAPSVLESKAEPPQKAISIKPAVPDVPPVKPPTAARGAIYTESERKSRTPGLWRGRWLVGSFAAAIATSVAVAATAVVTGGCTAVQWANFVTVSQTIASYILIFLQTAVAAWADIVPLLGDKAADLTARFEHAVAGLRATVAAMLDAAHAADLAQQSTLDLSAFITAIKTSVADIMTVIAEAKAVVAAKHPTGVVGAELNTQLSNLDTQARAIATWRVK